MTACSSTDCVITAAARCAPPNNKPTPAQLRNCLPFLAAEFEALPKLRVIIGLGRIGFDAIVKTLVQRGFAFSTKTPKFAHGAQYDAALGSRRVTVLGSYHPSRQNTNTGVLTAAMLDAVLARASQIVKGS